MLSVMVLVVNMPAVRFHRRTQSITLLQKPICNPADFSKTYGTFMALPLVDESGKYEYINS